MKTLSLVVPSYNAQDYLLRCLKSLVPDGEAADVEVIVIDDGSTDSTAAAAEQFAAHHPETVRVIRQANAGHGGAINTGVAHARGEYLKVVDSDDWLDRGAYAALLDELRASIRQRREVDLFVTNYVYEKVGRKRRAAVRYGSVMPLGRDFGWEEVQRFRPWQYLLMHALTYRTEVLRRAGLTLPRHTFYVDNLFAFVPSRTCGACATSMLTSTGT
ncbi:glycosyltransferase family 2 protein [Nesterenkonia pannonica]|uniref:glycosyltransferase family 2 protein n=1 Tax=Nesterenkonia pannonica TaxID=1548602 RepID=UPI002164C1EC|nr:glycosyltransferase family A protein [Nesterenkonia pannonica]